MEIKKKIAVWCALFALLVALVPPSSAKANTAETSEVKQKYTDINDYLTSMGLNMPLIEIKDGYTYLMYYSEYLGKYIVRESLCNFLYYSADAGKVFFDYTGAMSCNSYKIIGGKTDYSDEVWEYEENLGYNQIAHYDIFMYCDLDVYSYPAYNEVVYYSDREVSTMPNIPNALKYETETIVCGRYSVLDKDNANEPFIIVGSGEPVLRMDNMAIAFVDAEGKYTSDIELWSVGSDGEWYIEREGLSAVGGSDVTGCDIKYAPFIEYTNKAIYKQDVTLSGVVASSELYCDVSEGAYVAPSETPTPTVTPSTGVQNQTLYMYSVEYTGSVVSAYASLYEVCNGSDDDILVDLLKGMRVNVHGWTTDANGDMWYYCTYTNVYEGEVTGEFTGFIKSNSIGLTYSSGDTDEEQDMTLREQLQVISSFVLSVPMIISALFSFMPPWSLTLVGIAFSITAILMLRKG